MLTLPASLRGFRQEKTNEISMKLSKSVSRLHANGNLLLLVKGAGDRLNFGVFDIAKDELRFVQTLPAVRGDVWCLSESDGLLACAGWENGMVSTFDTMEGLVKSGVKVAQDAGVLIHEGRIRVCAKSMLHEFDLHGKFLGKHRFHGSLVRDIGKFIISEEWPDFHIMNGHGVRIAEHPPRGLGITSATLWPGGLAISESRGPITLFDEAGMMIWEKQSPAEFHPVSLACGVDGNLFAVHGSPSTGKSLLAVYDAKGTVLVQHELSAFVPVRAFSTGLPGWVFGGLEFYKFDRGRFVEGRFDSLKTVFCIED